MTAQTIHQLLREAFLYLHHGDDQALAEFDLDVVQFESLTYLSPEIGRSIGDLRERLLIDKSRATRVIDDLESRDLVRRVANPSDRRSPKIVLTKAGTELRGRAGAAYESSLNRRLAGLSPEEQTQLGLLLDKLIWRLLAELQTEGPKTL